MRNLFLILSLVFLGASSNAGTLTCDSVYAEGGDERIHIEVTEVNMDRRSAKISFNADIYAGNQAQTQKECSRQGVTVLGLVNCISITSAVKRECGW